jgi:hypothetical protein
MAQAIQNINNIISTHTESNLYHIAEYIESKVERHAKPTILYLGVGTYMCRFQKDVNGTDYIPLQDAQQFPPTLQSIYQNIPDSNFYIVLIDKLLENPPYITVDKHLENSILNGERFVKSMFNPEIEMYKTSRIEVFIVRDYISVKKVSYHTQDNTTDIEDNLRYFHDICIKQNITYVYHDYSGANLRCLYNLFNDEIRNNLEHIIYGFGNGYIDDCIINMLEPKSQLVTKLIHGNRPIIKCYNIDYIINKNINLYEYISQFDISKIELISEINKYVFQKIYEEFYNNIVYIFRKLKEYQEQISSGKFVFNEQMLFPYNCVTVEKSVINKLNDLISSSDNSLFEKGKEIFGNQYYKFFKLCIANTRFENYTSQQLINFITSDPNPYNWYNSVKIVLNI